jgi:hypothetical protein
MRLPDLEPGTWADWANAAATTLGFTVALVLFVIGLRDRRRADEDRRQADLDRRRQQARMVWIWPVSWTRDESEPTQVGSIRCKITNDSDAPISNCQISIQGEPWLPIDLFGDEVGPQVLPARQSDERDYVIQKELDVRVPFHEVERWRGPPIVLRFTDAAGFPWRRQ